VSGSAISPSDGVHFVNLTSFDEDGLDYDAPVHSVTRSDLELSSQSEVSTTASNRTGKVSGGAQPPRMFSRARDPIEISSSDTGKVTGMTSLPSSQFVIPELPAGKLLTINILSTWGDPHYVGLVGIDIFSRSGHLVRLSNPESQIWADPADINVLSEYGETGLLPSIYVTGCTTPTHLHVAYHA
jgi:hypothetical protein